MYSKLYICTLKILTDSNPFI